VVKDQSLPGEDKVLLPAKIPTVSDAFRVSLTDDTDASQEGGQFNAKPGDATLDLQFDQFDIVLALQGGKYMTGVSAEWAEGDWNGDGAFDQLDIVTALQTGNYMQGPYALRESLVDSLLDKIGR
jgi:hypothetical protein